MARAEKDLGLTFLDDLVADGITAFSFEQACQRTGTSRAATSNLLGRLVEKGFVDRVRRGHYVVRELGMLGTRAAAQDVALAVGAAFAGKPHRIAYRSALDEHDLLTHPSRTIQVATPRRHRMRLQSLSGRPLRVVFEPAEAIRIGTISRQNSWISDVERALLDGGHRPDLIGGAAVLAEALIAVSSRGAPERLIDYARNLRWGTALRRIGSLADALEISGLAGRLSSLTPPKGDIDLDPSSDSKPVWRDTVWWVRWPNTAEEVANVARQ